MDFSVFFRFEQLFGSGRTANSYEESYVGYPDFNRLIDKEFRRNGVNADIRIVYLDCEAFQEKHF